MAKGGRLKQVAEAEFTCDSRSFWSAATYRFGTARFLLDSQSGRHLDAVDLAGYVVECSLKALILTRTPRGCRGELCVELTTGARSHGFLYLRRTLRTKGCAPSPQIRDGLGSLEKEWGTNLRYVGALIPLREAESFLRRVTSVYDWVERRL